MKPVILSSAMWGSVFIKENMSGIEPRNFQGLSAYTGKLCGQPVSLLEVEENNCLDVDKELISSFAPDCLISLGEAYSCKKRLRAGNFIISSFATYLDYLCQNQLKDAAADNKLIDLSLKSVEKFINDDCNFKVVVGKVFINPGNRTTGRKLNFLPQNGIYCIDTSGFPLTQWAAESNLPFVLIRAVVPPFFKCTQYEITTFKWEMAKRNFWIIKGILEGLKKRRFPETVRKVD